MDSIDAANEPVPEPEKIGAPSASRSDLQLGRRLFHLLNGVATATAYALLFTHEQVIHIFGTIACMVYILDRVRIAYPEVIGQHAPWVNRIFLRAEEEVREAAMTPFAIAVLLTIITVPKPAAVVAIYTLGIADPLAAIIGIRFGRHRLTPNRTLEGSLAFLLATFGIAWLVLGWDASVPTETLASAAGSIAILAASAEVVPLRIDDNMTIPLFTAFITWIIAAAFGIALS